jgi:reversibly glycosylated polypeptide
MKTTIVTTTIYVPHALEKYGQNAKFYGHSGLNFIVIGDKKTPPETRAFCEHMAARYYPCEYLGIEDQETYLDRYPDLWRHLPFHSIQRRNVGLLKAWEDGADVVITIDDDNWMLNHDFVRLHRVVGECPELPAIESSSGWFNVCSLLEEASGTPFYHRGYPREQRWKEHAAFTCTASIRRRIAVNAGLWLDDPDIDAMTRLERPIVVRGMRPGAPERFVLQPGTWSPFNSQNTALLREVIPAYFVSPCVGRYDDIWPSYIVTRIANHLGDVIAYGQPLMRQKRNEHDLWKDLDNERVGSLLTDEFCAALRSIPLRGATYHQCYGELAIKLRDAWQPARGWTEAMIQAREGLLEGMTIWHEAFSRAGANADQAGDPRTNDLKNLALI